MIVIGEGIQANQEKLDNHQSTLKYTMAWLKTVNPSWKHVSDQHFAITEFAFHCIAFYLITGALEWSTFSSGLTQRIPPFGTNYHRAWFYDLSLQHPPTLWARSEGSSVSIVDLHCTLGKIHTTTEKKKNHVLDWWDLVVEHIPNLWQQVCIACNLLYQSQRGQSQVL